MMTKQQFYDKTISHLVRQGTQSGRQTWYTAFQCLYRGPNNTSCAIGVHIPDSIYRPSMEGCAISSGLLSQYPEMTHVIPKGATSLASDLQGLHDIPANWTTSGFSDQGKDTILDIAERHDLVPYMGEWESRI